jgi:hypothetical protein
MPLNVRPDPHGQLRLDAAETESLVREHDSAVVVSMPNDTADSLIDGAHRRLRVPAKKTSGVEHTRFRIDSSRSSRTTARQ